MLQCLGSISLSKADGVGATRALLKRAKYRFAAIQDKAVFTNCDEGYRATEDTTGVEITAAFFVCFPNLKLEDMHTA